MTAASREQIVERVREAVGPLPVLLCGSRATGEAHPGSDYDLLVVMPGWRIPATLGRLSAAAADLSRGLGAEVSLNPLPASRVRGTRAGRLFMFKLAREAEILAGHERLWEGVPERLELTADMEFSYLASAALYLAAPLPGDGKLPAGALPEPVRHGVRKALLHLAQLTLLRDGRYESTFDAALEAAGDAELLDLARLVGEPAGWLGARNRVVAELRAVRRPSRRMRALRRNVQYVGLSALRGRWRGSALLSGREPDAALADTLVSLLRAVPFGDLGWARRRDFVVTEWPSAHPLVAV